MKSSNVMATFAFMAVMYCLYYVNHRIEAAHTILSAFKGVQKQELPELAEREIPLGSYTGTTLGQHGEVIHLTLTLEQLRSNKKIKVMAQHNSTSLVAEGVYEQKGSQFTAKYRSRSKTLLPHVMELGYLRGSLTMFYAGGKITLNHVTI